MDSRLRELEISLCLSLLLLFPLVVQALQVAPSQTSLTIRTSGDIKYAPAEPPESNYLISLGANGYDVTNTTSGQVVMSTNKASAAFNWAIGRLPKGGTVGFEVGYYNFSTYVDVIYSGINIVGQGRDSVIFAEDNMNTWILRVVGEEDVHFFNFRIEGNKENQDISDGATNKGCGIYIRDSVDCSIEGVEANNCWARGLNVYGCSGTKILNCIAHDNGVLELGNIRYDNYAIHRSDFCEISNCVSIDPWMDNIVIYGCSNILVFNNTCTGTRSNYGSGVVVDGDSMDQSHYVTVRKNLLSNLNWGITGYNYDNCLFENNIIYDFTHDGIAAHYVSSEYIIDVVDVTIVNNILRYGGRNGIQIDSHNSNHMIRNNTISNIDEASIRVESAGNIKIWNNTISYSCTEPSQEGEGAIYLKGSPWQIDIQSNNILHTGSSKPSIFIGSGSQSVTVMHNHITERITNNAGSEATIMYTWKVGYETFPNGQVSYSFVHGLGGTPVNVEIYWMSDISSRTWNWTADSTYITVTLSSEPSSAYDFEWHARNWS